MYVNTDNNSFAKSAKLAVTASAAATATQALLLPAEAKAAVRNTLIGKDEFLAQSAKAAQTTINNLKKAGSNPKLSLDNVVKTAEELYPKIVEKGKKELATLGKSFVAITLGCICGKIIADAITKNKQ